MKNIFLYLSIVTLSLSCFSCDDDEELEVVTIGDASNIYISSEAGRREVPLTATCAWTVERDSLTRQWVNIERKSGEGDGSFNLVWRANEKFPRKGKVIVKLANKVKADTIYIYQYGVSPSIAFPDKEARVSAVGKELEVNLNTNIPASDSTRIAMTVDYDKGEKWVSQLLFNKEMNKMQVKVAPNEPEVGERNAVLHITYVDDWGKAYTTDFNISQMEMGGTKETKTISFAEARKLMDNVTGSQTINEDVAIEGIIVCDATGTNNAANTQLTQTKIDMTTTYRTVYIQSLDGKYGFALVFETKELNELAPFDKVKIWLKGLTLKKEDMPQRYTLTDMTLKSFISKEEGNATNLVKKERTIAELTDNDVYTFVTLKNCEFPIRKGSFTPFNEGYCPSYNVQRVDRYPLLMHDNQGQSMFLMTNTDCPYRREIYCHKVQEQYQVSLYMKNTLVSRMVEISDSIRCAISRVETLKSTNRKTTVFLLLLPNGMHSNFQVRKYFLRKVVVNCGTLLQLLQLQPIMAIWDLLMEKQMERELYLLLKIWLLTLQIGGTLPQGKETVG